MNLPLLQIGAPDASRADTGNIGSPPRETQGFQKFKTSNIAQA